MASGQSGLPALFVNILFIGAAESLYGAAGPEQATGASVGFDLRAVLPEGVGEVTIAPGERAAVPTGIAIEPLLPGVAGFVYARSGLGAVNGVTVAQGVGVIDPDYRGEIMVILLNTSQAPYAVAHGERIAQLLFQPCFMPQFRRCAVLGATERGGGGFGHTGKQ